MGFEVADRLHLPLDVIVARKLGVPWQPEPAMGAIAGTARFLDDRMIQGLAPKWRTCWQRAVAGSGGIWRRRLSSNRVKRVRASLRLPFHLPDVPADSYLARFERITPDRLEFFPLFEKSVNRNEAFHIAPLAASSVSAVSSSRSMSLGDGLRAQALKDLPVLNPCILRTQDRAVEFCSQNPLDFFAGGHQNFLKHYTCHTLRNITIMDFGALIVSHRLQVNLRANYCVDKCNSMCDYSW